MNATHGCSSYVSESGEELLDATPSKYEVKAGFPLAGRGSVGIHTCKRASDREASGSHPRSTGERGGGGREDELRIQRSEEEL
jgi:hypothetical protein